MPDVAVDPVVLESEPVQDFTGLRLERVAAEVLVLFLHFAEALEDLLHLAGAIGIGHRVVELLELVMELAGAAAAGDRLVDHRASRHLLDVLLEVADGQLPGDGDVPVVGRLLTDDHAEERGLAGPVGSDQADLFTGIELKGSVDEEDLLPVLLADLCKGNHSPDRTSLAALEGEGRRAEGGGRRTVCGRLVAIRYAIRIAASRLETGLRPLSSALQLRSADDPGRRRQPVVGVVPDRRAGGRVGGGRRAD